MSIIQPFSATFVASPANVRHQVLTFLLGKVTGDVHLLHEVVSVADDFESRLMPYAGGVPFFEIGLTNQTNSRLSDTHDVQKYNLGGDNLWVRFEPLTDRKDIHECRQAEDKQLREAVANAGLNQLDDWRRRIMATAQVALTEAMGDPLSFGAALNSIRSISSQAHNGSRLAQAIQKVRETPEALRAQNAPSLKAETQKVRREIVHQLSNGSLPPAMRVELLKTLNTLRDNLLEKPLKLQDNSANSQAVATNPRGNPRPAAQRIEAIIPSNAMSVPPSWNKLSSGQILTSSPVQQLPSNPQQFFSKVAEATVSIVRAASTALAGSSVASTVLAASVVVTPAFSQPVAPKAVAAVHAVTSTEATAPVNQQNAVNTLYAGQITDSPPAVPELRQSAPIIAPALLHVAPDMPKSILSIASGGNIQPVAADIRSKFVLSSKPPIDRLPERGFIERSQPYVRADHARSSIVPSGYRDDYSPSIKPRGNFILPTAWEETKKGMIEKVRNFSLVAGKTCGGLICTCDRAKAAEKLAPRLSKGTGNDFIPT